MSFKSTIIEKCPDYLFATLWNAFKSRKSGIRIDFGTLGSKWSISTKDMILSSPTAKFTSIGIKQFEDKFEKYFKIEKGDTCLDVGACIGDTTLPMAMKAGKEATIYAVEPNDLNFNYLLTNLTGFNLISFNLAVWNEAGYITFHEHSSPTGHSLIPLSLRKKETKVETDTIDNLFKGIVFDFAKIDVQSAEIEVLQGATEFLKTTRKLIVECHHDFKNELHDTHLEVFDILMGNYTDVVYEPEYNLCYAWR